MISLTDMKNSYIIILIKGNRKAISGVTFAKLTDAAVWANHKSKQHKCSAIVVRTVGGYHEQ